MLVRCGLPGAEKPAPLDAEGKLCDLLLLRSMKGYTGSSVAEIVGRASAGEPSATAANAASVKSEYGSTSSRW